MEKPVNYLNKIIETFILPKYKLISSFDVKMVEKGKVKLSSYEFDLPKDRKVILVVYYFPVELKYEYFDKLVKETKTLFEMLGLGNKIELFIDFNFDAMKKI